MAVHDLLKGREYNQNKAVEGFDEVNNSRTPRAVHQSGYADVLVHTQQSTVPPGVAEHNVTVARAFTKLMGAFVTFWDNDAGSKIHLLANPGQDVAPIGAAGRQSPGVADAAGQPATL